MSQLDHLRMALPGTNSPRRWVGASTLVSCLPQPTSLPPRSFEFSIFRSTVSEDTFGYLGIVFAGAAPASQRRVRYW